MPASKSIASATALAVGELVPSSCPQRISSNERSAVFQFILKPSLAKSKAQIGKRDDGCVTLQR